VEERLTKKFAKVDTKLFMNFGDNAYGILKGGLDWTAKALTNFSNLGKKPGGAK
jgi:hypothetical protein